MKSLVSMGFTAVVLLLVAQQGAASVCERETFFGQTDFFNCPQPTDDPDDKFCCGTDKNRYCCDTPFGVDAEVFKEVAEKEPVALAQVQETPVVPKTANDQEGLRDRLNPKVGIQKAKDKVKQKIKDKVAKKLDPTGSIKSLPVILGVIAAVILGLIVLCIVCCCCCPFCLLHKRRNRGTVHNPNTADVTVTQPLQPMQPGQQYPVHQPYPPQPYPQPYPPSQPYPPQGYPAQPGYPQQPMPPHAQQPAVYPDLTEK